jgi:hypothetical protein
VLGLSVNEGKGAILIRTKSKMHIFVAAFKNQSVSTRTGNPEKKTLNSLDI